MIYCTTVYSICILYDDDDDDDDDDTDDYYKSNQVFTLSSLLSSFIIVIIIIITILIIIIIFYFIAANCNITIKDPKCWFDSNMLVRTFDLDLSGNRRCLVQMTKKL